MAALDAIEYALAGEVRFGLSAIMILVGLAGGAVGIVLGNRLPLQAIRLSFAGFLAIIAAYMIAQHV